MEYLDLETEEDKGLISLPDDGPTVSRSPQGVQERTKEAMIASGGTLDPELTAYDYSQGNDGQVDRVVSAKEYENKAQTQRDLLKQAIADNDPNTAALLEGLGMMQFPEPSGSVRRQYASEVVNQITANSQKFNEAYETEDPDDVAITDGWADVTRSHVEAASALRDVYDRKSSAWGEKSFLGKTASVLGSLAGATVLMPEVLRHDAIEKAPTSSLLTGSNSREQAEYLWLRAVEDPKGAAEELERAYDNIAQYNEFEAQLFLEGMMDYSMSDELWDNVFAVIDTATVIPLVGTAAKGAVRLGQKAVSAKTVAKETGKSVTRNGPDTAKIARDLGENKVAAAETMAKELDPVKAATLDVDDVIDILPAHANPDAAVGAVKSSGANTLQKLRLAVAERGAIADWVVKSSVANDISRLSVAELQRGLASEVQKIAKTHPSIKESVVEASYIAGEKTADNVDRVAVTFGKTDGSFFDTEKSAKTWLSRHLPDLKDVSEVVEVGDKWAIKHTRPMEIGEDIRGMALTADAKMPEHRLTRLARSAGTTLSPEQVRDRRTISDAHEKISQAFKKMGQPVVNLNKKAFAELSSFLDDVYSIPNKKTGRVEWRSVEDANDLFQERLGKYMTEAQMDAYAALRQIDETTRIIKAAALTKAKMRAGVTRFTIKGFEGPVEGRLLTQVPWDEKGRNIKVLALDSEGKPLTKVTSLISKEGLVRKQLDELVGKGYHVIQLYEPTAFKVGKNNRNITYVVTNNAKQSKISVVDNFDTAPGSLRYEHPYYIKQAKVKNSKYFGDDVVFGAKNAHEANIIKGHLEEYRRLAKSDAAAAKTYATTHLPEFTDEALDALDLERGFDFTRSGRTLKEEGKVAMEGVTDMLFSNPHNLRAQLEKKSPTGVLKTLRAESDALVNVEPSKSIGVVESLTQNLGEAVSERVMADYVDKTTQRFFQEFKDVLGISYERLKANPLAVMNDPNLTKGLSGRHAAAVHQFVSALNHFVEMPTPTSRFLKKAKGELLDWAVGRLGDTKAGKWLDERLIHTLKDPTQYFRAAAFHLKLGLFNPKQLFLQGSVVSHVVAIAGPTNGYAAGAAYMIHRSMAFTRNPETLAKGYKMIEKVTGGRFKAKWAKESEELFQESGWGIIGGSVSTKDVTDSPRLIKGALRTTLDYGLAPFKAGEHIGRGTAWNAAYLEFRLKNPNAVITRADIQKIRLRANDMTANMTRDMNAAYQRGLMATTSQFTAYQMRVFEQLIGAGRLSKTERARLALMQSALYGVPVGASATVMPLWPIHEEVRQYLIENGYKDDRDPNSLTGVAQKVITDGIASYFTEFATGTDGLDMSNYGAGGLPMFKELVQGKKDGLELMGGASLGIAINLFGEGGKVVGDVFKTAVDPELDFIAPTSQDVTDFLNHLEISTVSNLNKLVTAAQLGYYVSKNNYLLDDATVREAVFAFLLGATPEEQANTWAMIESGKELKKDTDAKIRDVEDIWRKVAIARIQGRDEEFFRLVRRAKMWSGAYNLSVKDHIKAMQAGVGEATLADETFWNYMTKVIPEMKRKERSTQ